MSSFSWCLASKPKANLKSCASVFSKAEEGSTGGITQRLRWVVQQYNGHVYHFIGGFQCNYLKYSFSKPWSSPLYCSSFKPNSSPLLGTQLFLISAVSAAAMPCPSTHRYCLRPRSGCSLAPRCCAAIVPKSSAALFCAQRQTRDAHAEWPHSG